MVKLNKKCKIRQNNFCIILDFVFGGRMFSNGLALQTAKRSKNAKNYTYPNTKWRCLILCK